MDPGINVWVHSSALTAAAILADAAVTLRNDLKCVEWDVKSYYTYAYLEVPSIIRSPDAYWTMFKMLLTF